MGDPSRISAQIVTGIGFLGAGAIFRSKFGVSGMTTAALMWVTAALGLSVGNGHPRIAVAGTITTLIVIYTLKLLHQFLRWLRPDKYVGDEYE